MKFFITILIILTSHLLSAQINLRNLSLTIPDSALLYYGLENKIEILGTPYQASIKYTSTNSDIQVDSSRIIIVPKKFGIDTIKVYNGKLKIFQKTFLIVKLETPVIQIANSIDSFLDKDRIIKIPYVSLKVPNCLYKFRTIVYSYNLTILNKSQERIEFNMMNNEITMDALNVIQTLKHGDQLYFENIIGAVQPSFCPRGFGDKIIKIK